MKTLLDPWFVIGCIVWLAVFALRRTHYPMPQVYNDYLTDVFAIPVISNLGLWFMRVAIVKTNQYRLSAGQIIFVIAYVSIIFEVILPHFFKAYTGDLIDILMYIAGGFFFYRIMNKPG